MEYIYAVDYDGKISSECYPHIEMAIDFICSRTKNPKKLSALKFKDDNGNIYTIHILRNTHIKH